MSENESLAHIPDGETVRLAGAGKGKDGNISLAIIEKGLHIQSIVVKDKQGKEHDVIIAPDSSEEMVKTRTFAHCMVGRYCNRIPDSKITIPGTDISFTPASFGQPGTSLHGGPAASGWDAKLWTKLSPKDADLFSSAEQETLSKAIEQGRGQLWTYTSPDGEGGHPGDMVCQFATVVEEDGADNLGEVTLVYRAKLLSGEAGLVNLTHHWGFNLDASDAGRNGPTPKPKDVSDHVLTIKSSNILELESSSSLPTGELIKLDRSVKDCRSGKVIGEPYPEGGIDDFWVFDREPQDGVCVKTDEVKGLNAFEEAKTSTPVASLGTKNNDLLMTFRTNQSGVQCWTGHGGYNGSDARKVIHGGRNAPGQGDGYHEPSAVFLEFHQIYDGWLHDKLRPLGWDTVIRKGEVYNNWTKATFSQKN